MMAWTPLLFGFVTLQAIFTSAHQNDCYQKHRGTCYSNRYPCPTGYYTPPGFEGYFYCGNVYQKCCIRSVPVTQRPTTPAPTQRSIPTPPRPYRGNCGKSASAPTDRILNGFDTGPCNWPFVVSLRSTKVNGNGNLDYDNTLPACSGTIIDPYWVLTTAFCILSAGDNVNNAPNRILVVSGEYNTSKIDLYPSDGFQQEQFHRVASAYIHPSYAFSNVSQVNLEDPRNTNSNNVALIKLVNPVTLGRCSAWACLPTVGEAYDTLRNYKNCRIFGWGAVEGLDPNRPRVGSSDILKIGAVQLSSRKACDHITTTLNKNVDRPSTSICQAPQDVTTDACLGDAGGPVLCADRENWVVRAILPLNVCFKDTFNLYAVDLTGNILTWIQGTMRMIG